jgi:hypothetical protein
MEPNTRRVKLPLEIFIKRSWPILALGAVLVSLTVAVLVWFALSGAGRKQAGEEATATSTAPEAPLSLDGLVPRALDGILVAPAESRLQPYAVMVENHTEARPMSGPALANLAYEFPVEGGITRYLLVFDATTTVESIGPVRSARPYFVDVADGLDAVYAHVGGSPEALEQIKRLKGFRDLNEISNGKYFWRSAKRSAPHNVYTSSETLQQAATAKQFGEGSFLGWHYKDDYPLESATATVRGDEDGPTVKYGGSYNVAWKYDKETNAYARREAGTLQKDADGTPVVAKNVVVVRTDGQVLDAEGRLKIRTTGRGQAVIYRDGQRHEAQWRRNAGEHYRFETTDGADVLFNRGTTWIQVSLNSGTFDYSTSTASATSTKQ